MKRVLAMICALVLIAAVFTACGENKNATNINGIEVEGLVYETENYKELYLVMTNKTGKDCDIEVTVHFLDADGKEIDKSIFSEYAFGADTTIADYAMTSEWNFDSYTCEVEVKDLSYYVPIDKDLDAQLTGEGEDLTLTVTNNSSKAASYPSYYIFYFKEDKLVAVNRGIIDDDDSEIKAGKTQTEEVGTDQQYDNYQIYVHSNADKD